jgi:3-oxoadipate enol-lactonase
VCHTRRRSQLCIFHHRGYGESETEEVPDSIAIYAEDALAVLDEVGVDQAIVGGMSMGGPIAFEMYRQAADRFRGLVLTDTNANAATPFEAGQWQGAVEMIEMMGSVEAIVPLLLPTMLTGATRQSDPELVQFLTDVILTASTPAAVDGAQALANRDSYVDVLPDIEVPTLVVVGEEDALYSFKSSMAMQEAIPTSELVIILSGHAARGTIAA